MTNSSNPLDDLHSASLSAFSPDDAAEAAGEDEESEYEEICSDEVDRIVQALEELMADVESENIRAYLEEAADHIFSLVYDIDGSLEADADPSGGASDELAA